MSVDLMSCIIDGYKEVRAEKMIGIFGHPIKHTLSPVIHDTLSDILSVNERYVPFHIEPDMNLSECVRTAYDEGILGLNITVPYKQEVMQALVCVDEAARAIGAVNTLVRVDGGYKGYNTDMPGLARAIESEGILLKDKAVIILGAGGAARAVAYMCVRYGAARVYILNRTFENAKKISDDMNQHFDTDIVIPVAAGDYQSVPEGKYIFIQCTSVGLHEGDGLPLVTDIDFYNMAECGVDLIYNPAETPFIKLLRKLGVKAFNGLKMLLYQGIMAYELWNKVQISDDISKQVYDKLYNAVYSAEKHKAEKDETLNGNLQGGNSHENYSRRNIVLIGYMGAGKTTVGQYIAKKYNYRFLDTDEYIVEKAGMTINEIFADKGEAYFRELETRTLQEMKDTLTGCVISTGGGVPLRRENAELLKSMGTVCYLSADADTIYDRVKDCTDRPLLACENPYKRIQDMLIERSPKYKEAADIVLETKGKSLEEIAEYIVQRLWI